MEKELEVFLPTSQELSDMNLDEFDVWINKAIVELPERKIRRDPLSHLRKRISQILDETYETEEQREEVV